MDGMAKHLTAEAKPIEEGEKYIEIATAIDITLYCICVCIYIYTMYYVLWSSMIYVNDTISIYIYIYIYMYVCLCVCAAVIYLYLLYIYIQPCITEIASTINYYYSYHDYQNQDSFYWQRPPTGGKWAPWPLKRENVVYLEWAMGLANQLTPWFLWIITYYYPLIPYYWDVVGYNSNPNLLTSLYSNIPL